MENLAILPSFHKQLKNFIVSAKQYSHCHDELSLNAVICSLQILGQSSNQFPFDSKNTLIQEFYMSLYELMYNINDESELMWAAVNVFQSIMKQGFSCNSIINKYKFILIFTKLLKEQLPSDKKIKILKLLQDLTYGVKLQWQESYISELIILLVKWISSEDKDLVSFSLGVLVNVCCKNKFAMFTLVKCTNSKLFMRLLLKLQSDNIFIKLQVYKLLLILEQVSGQIPHIEINNLIDVTFVVLEEGLKQKNVFVLRHVIDFFVDICDHIHWKNSVISYSEYKPKLTKLLNVVENFELVEKSHGYFDITLQSVGLVLEFINHVIKLKNESLKVLYPKIIKQISHWAQYVDLYQQSMLMLQTIIINVRNNNSSMDQNIECDLHKQLEESLNVLLNLLMQPCSDFVSSSWDRYAICLSILQEMLKQRHLQEKIEEKLDISSFQSVFHSLILVDIKDTNNLQNISSLYIEALSFLSDLVAKNPKWMSLYSEVLNQKQVYSVLAYIIYNGPKKMKRKVLDLITKFSQQSTVMLSDCLEEINQSSLRKQENMYKTSLETEIKPLCSFAQEEQLQVYIDQLENMLNSNEIKDLKTSNVIKLYQYKLNLSQQTEACLKQSLDNASGEINHLNFKIMSLNNESITLNQMLLENHQIIDELTIENSELKKKLNYITEQFSTISNDFAKLSRNYETKQQIIQDQDIAIKKFEKQLVELNTESNKMKENLLDQLQNEKSEHKKQIVMLEQEIMDKQIIIVEKSEDIDSKTSLVKNMEKCILEKDNDINDLRNQLQEQQRVREMISQMLAATSSKPQLSDN